VEGYFYSTASCNCPADVAAETSTDVRAAHPADIRGEEGEGGREVDFRCVHPLCTCVRLK